MKKKTIIILAIALLLIIVGIVLFIILRNPNTNLFVNKDANVNQEDITPGQPYLSMKIVDYPTEIDTVCDSVNIIFEAENLGDTTLKYEDMEDVYYFAIQSDNAIDAFFNENLSGTVDTSNPDADTLGLLPYTKAVSDFGEIKPGEKKSITFTSINYDVYGQHEYYWVNNFGSVANGSFDYYIEFGAQGEKYPFYTKISSSPSVNILTNLYDSNGGLSACDHEVINDPSIDFYYE